MKKIFITFVVILATLVMTGAALASPPESRNFVAPLSGRQQVPVRETKARGNAVFHLSADGSVLQYKLIVANIDNAFASHIHCGSAGQNGPIGVTLFTGPVDSGRADGILAQGMKMAPDDGNACGWVTLDDVAAAMRSGNAYVNVHTNDGIDPPNTGPGDFPGGEIRGQIREAGPTH
jgi:hypothetical protein